MRELSATYGLSAEAAHAGEWTFTALIGEARPAVGLHAQASLLVVRVDTAVRAAAIAIRPASPRSHRSACSREEAHAHAAHRQPRNRRHRYDRPRLHPRHADDLERRHRRAETRGAAEVADRFASPRHPRRRHSNARSHRPLSARPITRRRRPTGGIGGGAGLSRLGCRGRWKGPPNRQAAGREAMVGDVAGVI